jgi:hypothetical protein
MSDDIAIELQAKDVDANRLRAWRIEAGPDLFGVWVTTVRFGRIGMGDRTLGYQFASEAEVRAFVRIRLRRRGTAKRRIGVAYRVIAASPEAEPLLRATDLREPSTKPTSRSTGNGAISAVPSIAPVRWST